MTDRNHIQIAARTDILSHATHLLTSCLRLQETDIRDRIMPDAATWKRMTYFQKVEVISEWLQAECFACVEDEEVPVVEAAQ